LKDGSVQYFPFLTGISAWHDADLFALPRCLTCFDTTNRLADIAFGDPWSLCYPGDQGVTVAIVRTAYAEHLFNEAVASGAIQAQRMTDTEIKRWRPTVFRLQRTASAIWLRTKLGKATPNYEPSVAPPTFLGMTAYFTAEIAGFTGRQRWLWGFLGSSLRITLPLFRWLRSKLAGVFKGA